MNDALIVSLLSVVPKGLGSRLQGAFGRLGLSRYVIRWYAGHYGVNTDEMVGSIDDYATLQAFFVRPLKADCLLYTSPSPRDQRGSRMPSSA